MTNTQTKVITLKSWFFQTLSLCGNNPDREAPKGTKPERVHLASSPEELLQVIKDHNYKFVSLIYKNGDVKFIRTESYTLHRATQHFERFAK